jgi:hypothetical protein
MHFGAAKDGGGSRDAAGMSLGACGYPHAVVVVKIIEHAGEMNLKCRLEGNRLIPNAKSFPACSPGGSMVESD